MHTNKKLLSLISIIAFLMLSASAGAAPFLGGDANTSGEVDIDDVVYLINYIFTGGPSPEPYESGDVNTDGLIDIDDVVYLINYLFMGGPEPNCVQYTIPSTTTIIPKEDEIVIQDYDTTTGTIILDESSVYAQELTVGDIAIGQNDSVAPYGFLRKVTSKTTQGSSIVLETDTATMMEAFDSLYVKETNQLRPSDVVEYKLHPGVRYTSTKDDDLFSVELGVVLYDQDGNHGTTDDQIRLDGNLAFSAALFAEIEIEWFQLKKFEAGIESGQEASVDLTANLQWQFGAGTEFDLATFHLSAIPVGPVVLVPTLTVEAHIHGDLTVTFETGITYTQQLRFGLGWANDLYYQISQGTKSFAYTPPQLATEFNFEPGVSLNASCLLYGVAGPYVAGKTGLHFQAALNADPCDMELTFDLEAILYALAGIECDILGLDYNHQWQLYNYLIGEWVFPFAGTIVVDPEPDSLNAPWSLVGPCSYSSSGNGDETLTSLDPGDYTVTWGEVSGWITPAEEMQTLAADDTVTFNGVYVDDSDSLGTVTDYDGNVYQTIKIGDQWWMMENLKVTHYRNGDPIPHVTDGGEWSGLYTGAYCAYDNDPANVSTYGRLYNWYAVDDSRNIAPTGWHVPTNGEWQTLVDSLGGSSVAGGKMKEAGTTHWYPPNTGATNESGFSALPGGYRHYYGYFDSMGIYAYFWSSTKRYSYSAWDRELYYYYSRVYRYAVDKSHGFSVRCVQD